MINLLKADLFRVLRTKIVYIGLIVAVGLPLFMAGSYALTNVGLSPEEIDVMKEVYGNLLLTSTFSSLLSFSFVFAIFPVIVIMMDFGNGTIMFTFLAFYNRFPDNTSPVNNKKWHQNGTTFLQLIHYSVI